MTSYNVCYTTLLRLGDQFMGQALSDAAPLTGISPGGSEGQHGNGGTRVRGQVPRETDLPSPLDLVLGARQ